jgi:microcystin-dependent protein
MSRNQSGNYSLPLPPVNPGDTVESQWANLSLGDIGEALTQSLDRSGRGAMLAPLILAPGTPTQSQEAVSKSYVDSFLSHGTGIPVGTVISYASYTPPAGFLLCDGRAVSRTTYATLFGAIGTLFGAGDSTSTFNLPDMRDQFIRGKNDTRAIGSVQQGSFASHSHAVSDPTHTHGATGVQSSHNHTVATNAHTHGVSDPGHTHPMASLKQTSDFAGGGNNYYTPDYGSTYSTGAAVTGIAIAAAGNIGGTTDSKQPALTVTVSGAATGIAIGATGGTENVPQNLCLVYYIKAENDTAGGNSVVAITSSDSNMISIVETNPAIPQLLIHSNVAFGIPKLDASGKILLAQLPQGSTVLLGYFDASSGANPSQAFPTTDYSNGEAYIVSVGGTILVRDPATSVESQTLVAVGGTLLYLEGQSQPDGWYYSIPVAASSASNISFLPEGTIVATNVQGAIAELDSETQAQIATLSGEITTLQTDKQDAATAVTKDSQTGGAYIPSVTTLERPVAPVYGQQRANSTLNSQEWWNGTAWVPMGGGATGGSGNGFVYENDIHVTQNYTLTANKNGMSAGPIIVDDGVTVTVPSGSVWSIV